MVSFRVENRKARPKIIKNVNNICNIFIFQNNAGTGNSSAASISQSDIRRKRRESYNNIAPSSAAASQNPRIGGIGEH